MNGPSDDGMAQSARPTTSRRGIMRRVLTFGGLAIVALTILAACGPEVEKPYTTTSPASPTAESIQSLYKLVFWLALVVFVGVQFAIVYTALRFRRTRFARRRPAQIHGNTRLEITWTVIPAVVLLIILIPTITTLYDFDAAAQNGDLEVDVYGKQWWWEVNYGEDERGEDLDVWTANEIVVPVGKNVVFNLQSNNVIHSFWVPRLSGKLDVMPGHVNRLSITADEPGVYYGECAEFCGAQHAWMRFKIVAVPENEFYTWINTMRAGNVGTTNPDAELPEGVTRAPEIFSVCLACHQVNGLESSAAIQGIEAPRTNGPDLTNLACRETIAAGMLINNPENMALWLHDPGAVKPENYMATVIEEGTLDEQQIQELNEYLFSLQPEGGCVIGESPDVPSGASSVGSPVASPAATPADD
ncbi:MAG: cytochrome c oxidase subunit II [Chloroflexia bacterium]|nr:cytochrome c oxidase subunit II [Chloroflexia bacterium]